MVRGHARDLTVPPPDSEEFGFLARRLGYGADIARLRDDLEKAFRSVRERVRLLELPPPPT
jgi:glutamate-ammonia-ligase adenylyltransferase